MKTNLTKEELGKSGIYQIANLVNGKIYVGSAVKFYNRKAGHINKLKRGVHVNGRLQNSWNKHGNDSFVFELLELVADKSNLIAREQYWIDLLKPEYNLCSTAGSMLGVKFSAESKAKMSLAHMGNKIQLGKKQSREHIAKRALANTGKNRSVETRAKMSLSAKGNKSNLGKIPSKEHREKISLANKGKQHMLGKKHTDESKAKMSLAQKGRKFSLETLAKMSLAAKKREANKKELQLA